MTRLTCLIFVAALCIAACGDNDDNAQNNVSGNNTTGQNTNPNGEPNSVDENIFPGIDFGVAMITAAEGGTVELNSGRGSIAIPAGALAEDTEVRIRLNTTITNHESLFNSGGGPVPFTINLEPAGTQLSAAATLRFEVTEEELSLANTDGQVWQFAMATNAGGEDAVIPATSSADAGATEVSLELTEFADYSPVGVGKVKLVPSCPDSCAVGSPHTLTVDVENVLAPTIGFDLDLDTPAPTTFTETASTGGIAAPMTHELVDFEFECTEAGTSTVTVDFTGNLGAEGPTFGWGAPIATDITCM